MGRALRRRGGVDEPHQGRAACTRRRRRVAALHQDSPRPRLPIRRHDRRRTLRQRPLPSRRQEPPAPRQHIAFCRAADGVRLAYAVAGEGPPLVRAANWMTHLGYDIESPVWKHWVRDLSLKYRFIRYDERGCGLSDWEATDFTFDDWVADLESVVEALGLERFPLLGRVAGWRRCGGVRRPTPRAGQPPGAVRRVRARPRGAGRRRRGKARCRTGS